MMENTSSESIEVNALEIVAHIMPTQNLDKISICTVGEHKEDCDEFVPEVSSSTEKDEFTAEKREALKLKAYENQRQAQFEQFREANPSRMPTNENVEKAASEIPYITAEQIKLDERTDLTEEQKTELLACINRFRHIFVTQKGQLGRIKYVKHVIEVTGRPVKQKPYQAAHIHREFIDKEISALLQQDLIRHSKSPWASSIVVLDKKDGTYRLCIDYRKLNAVTIKDTYPLPRIQEVLDGLAGSSFFSTFDMASGYWQVEMAEAAKEKTAFCAPAGLFEWNVMPFGLTNAPSTFQRLSEAIFAGPDYRTAYFDDILVYSKQWGEHVKHVEDTFMQCHLSGAMLKLSKCEFGQPQIHALGFICNKEGVSKDPKKLHSIANYPAPKSPKEIKQFLGMCGYYRQFIPNFSRIAEPMVRLLKKFLKFKWTDEQEQSFQKLKEMMAQDGVLAYPDLDKPFVLSTDASIDGLGAVLEQPVSDDPEDGMKPISYISRTTTEAERNYSITDLEAAAVVFAVKKFRVYLYGRPFHIITDHSALQFMFKSKCGSARVMRWALQLQEFDFKIIHRPGATNVMADALSRNPVDDAEHTPEICEIEILQ